jgi:hypothetical protein
MNLLRIAAFAVLALSLRELKAQDCLPAPAKNPVICTFATEPVIGFSDNGVWLFWDYGLTTDKPGFVHTQLYIGTWAEQPNVSARLGAIAGAADPLKSLQTAGQRFKISPLSDPSLSAVYRDAQAAVAKRRKANDNASMPAAGAIRPTGAHNPSAGGAAASAGSH